MEAALASLTDLLFRVAGQVATSVAHNWPFLLAGIVSAAALKVYVGIDRVAALFRRQVGLAVGASVTAAVATPFCSCGTTAVVLSMLATAVPWAPIVAFLVASPLSSPDELVFSAGLFGWPFAVVYFLGSIVLGVAGGGVAYVAERAGWLENQARFTERTPIAEGRRLPVISPALDESRPGSPPACGCESSPAMMASATASIGPGAASVAEFAPAWRRWRLPELADETIAMGRRMVVLFLGFAAIGYVAIDLVPTDWLTGLLGGTSPFAVVFAATLGLPFYLSSEASLPLVASLMAGGMGAGPAMAFLITGAGTSIGAMSGALLIARWRVLAIVVGTLWVGAIVIGLVASA
ncbi:MAG TPA: permease, partial [Candidatus Limnocylindrales bacterium]